VHLGDSDAKSSHPRLDVHTGKWTNFGKFPGSRSRGVWWGETPSAPSCGCCTFLDSYFPTLSLLPGPLLRSFLHGGAGRSAPHPKIGVTTVQVGVTEQQRRNRERYNSHSLAQTGSPPTRPRQSGTLEIFQNLSIFRCERPTAAVNYRRRSRRDASPQSPEMSAEISRYRNQCDCSTMVGRNR
jgi:hypothetical protein